jgi:acetyl-CoA acyltransferase
MRDAVIVEAVGNPVGKRSGGLSMIALADFSDMVLNEVVARTGVDPGIVHGVCGCVGQIGEQPFDVARDAVLGASWRETARATTVDRQCGSSRQAVRDAGAGLISRQYALRDNDVRDTCTPRAQRPARANATIRELI